jgi:hypothetical protein
VRWYPEFGGFVACVLRRSLHLPRIRLKHEKKAFRNLNPRLRVAASKAGSNKTKQESQTMNDYKPSSRPAAFGVFAVALTALTIGLAVVLPAKMDAGNHAVHTVVAPQPASVPAADPDSGPIRIDVIARRDSTWMPVRTHLTSPKSKAQGSGRAGTHAVAAPEPLSGADARLQPALCPYLISGTVAATS